MSASTEDKIERFIPGLTAARTVADGQWAVTRWGRAICRRHGIALGFANVAMRSATSR